MSDKTALVLGGGGSHGSYELGVWKALRELGIDIYVVTGTSIGAINGAMIAQGDYEKAVSLWSQIETSQVIDLSVNEEHPLNKKVWQTYQSLVVNFVKSGGTATNPLRQTLGTFIDEERVRKLKIEYGLVTIKMDKNVPHELFWLSIKKQGSV